MGRTLKDATVNRYHYTSHDDLRGHVQLFLDAYNHARRLKALCGFTPYEFTCQSWTKEPDRFRINPSHHTPGLNSLELGTKLCLRRWIGMALLVPDDLWQAIEPLLPPRRPKPKGRRPRAPDRAALAGILFVLRTGIQWHEVPAELGCCGKTCWRRLGE